MIRKIQSGEYLKRYDNMTVQERQEYESRVGQWLSDYSHMLAEKGDAFEARLQNVQQVSMMWNDEECQAFEDGARLLSALVPTADTWLPDMLYTKSTKRAIRQMVEVLWGVDEGNETSRQNRETQDNKAKEEPAEGAGKATLAVAPFQGNKNHGAIGGRNTNGEGKKEDVRGKMDDGTLNPEPLTANQGVVPARPKHIDQYVHLLPKQTQERAAKVQGLYREMDEARQKMQLLMDDKTASAADREVWAKKATKCDNSLRKIFDELDAEWAKLVEQGRVMVDDLGNARILPVADAAGVVTGQPADEAQEPAELTSEQRARRRELRKWLTDTRRGNGVGREERVKQWKVNFQEYLTLEGDKAFGDEKILEAAKHYGIELDGKTPGTSNTTK